MAKSHNPAAGNPGKILATELKLARSLKKLLLEEKESLGQRDFDRLKSITEAKHQLLDSFEQQERQRSAIVNATGLAGVEMQAAWDKIIESGDASWQQSWAQLQQEMELCREVNHINELVVGRSKAAVQQVLNILRGNPGNDGLYNKQGSKLSGNRSSAYVSA